MKKIKLFALSFTLTLVACGAPSSPNLTDPSSNESPIANPYPRFHGNEVHGEKNFAVLINNYSEGKVEPMPWVGYWWPYTSNGIANGSYGGGLSPAGKYDAARGGATNAQGWEIGNHGARVRGVQGWWGHCNGWCAAAALFPEPIDSVFVNRVQFGIADIKALLTEAGMAASADFYGNRVDYGSDYDTPKYTDTVPDQYFLVLTNYIGKLHQAVLIDRYTGDQVWNQPLAGFRIEYPTPANYLGADPAAPNVYRIIVNSAIWWMNDEVPPGVITPPFNFEDNQFVSSRVLSMEVWLDAPVVFGPDGKIKSAGNVIVTRQGDYFAGGAWRMGDGAFAEAWPDYMWVPYSVVKVATPEEDPDSDEDYANPYIDIDWLRKHILVPNGMDDPSVDPRPVEPAPIPSASPSRPPIPSPSSAPLPVPAPGPSENPIIQPSPTNTPSMAPQPEPSRSVRS